jgi:hypothetical protein
LPLLTEQGLKPITSVWRKRDAWTPPAHGGVTVNAMSDLTPEPHYILSVRNQGLPWWKALSELIDNGFDAKANRVEITVKGRTVTVTDNGRGMPDVIKAIRLGGHVASYGRGLGMYGVGLKDAWLSSGDKIDIRTVHAGLKTTISVDIRQIGSDWIGPDPTIESTTEKDGTTIVLHLRDGRNIPTLEVFQKLGFIFSPAITQGLQIVRINGGKTHPVSATPLPPFSESVQDTFDIQGKSVSLNIGILRQGERMPEGPFCFAYRHRIIEHSSLGAKNLSCMAMGGIITLGDGWVFTKNKDAIAENSDELEDEIYSRIKHLLVKANKMAIDVQSDQMKTELESMVNEALGEAKREARHSTRDTHGTVKPAGSGKKRTRASKIHVDLPGSVTQDADGIRRRGVKIDWCQIGSDQIGKYDPRTNTVNLNLDHQFVAAVKVSHNNPAMFAVAFAIYTDWICTHAKDGSKTLFDVDDFGSTLGRLIKGMRLTDDKTRKASGGGSVSSNERESVQSIESGHTSQRPA